MNGSRRGLIVERRPPRDTFHRARGVSNQNFLAQPGTAEAERRRCRHVLYECSAPAILLSHVLLRGFQQSIIKISDTSIVVVHIARKAPKELPSDDRTSCALAHSAGKKLDQTRETRRDSDLLLLGNTTRIEVLQPSLCRICRSAIGYSV